MMMPPDDDQLEPDAAQGPEQAARELEPAQQRVLAAVAAGAFDTIEQNVAWILNSVK
jgi:hypothetical protein